MLPSDCLLYTSKVLLAEKAQSAEKDTEAPAEPMPEVPVYRETANYAYEAGEPVSYTHLDVYKRQSMS